MENLLGGLCEGLKKNHPLFVLTSYADPEGRPADWVSRPRRPGFLAFTLHTLTRGFLFLWRRPDIRVILGGSAMVTLLVLILARFFRRKAIVNVHGLDLVYPNAVYQLLCVRRLRHCDRVIANSRYTAALAEQKKVPRNSVSIIPPGIDSETRPSYGRKEAKKEMGLVDRKILLYVGRLARRKGVKEFIQGCLPSIIAEVPDVVFLVVGGNPTESLVHRDDVFQEVQSVVREMGVEDHVRLLGWLSAADLAKVYEVADILVLPAIPVENDVEGFGIVILEAAAAGKPCVASSSGGIPDAIEDGKSGTLVRPGDYRSMSHAVLELLRNDELRQSMGEYARRRVRDKFVWDTVVKEYAGVFDALSKTMEG